MKGNVGITKFFLGVDHGNLAAVKAYNKIGFKKIKNESGDLNSTKMIMAMSV